MYLQFQQKDSNGLAVFLLQKRDVMTSYNFDFSLRYYPAYQGYQGSRSGASIFRPAVNESRIYSNLSDFYYQEGPVCSQITLKYYNSTNKESGVAKARVYSDSKIVEWVITIDEIPISYVGKEVTTNFGLRNIDNSEIFFTDTNGLEMQERQLNYRPTW